MKRASVSVAVAACALAASALAGLSPAAGQSNFPTRPITLVVPLPAGGTADLLCRIAADRASANLGQQVVVENRPGGAGGRVGTEQVMRSAPDGYTLLCGTQLIFSITHVLFPKANFDTRSMEPISVLATYPLIIITRGNFPGDTMQDFIQHAKAANGKVTYGHQGKGNTGHLLGELMMLKGGFKMTEVPYRGSAPAINDMLAGTIDMVPDYLLSNKQNIDAGKLKLLATAGHERLKDYPKVPMLSEIWPGVHSITWMAVAAPAGTPKDITRKISDAIGKGFRQPDVQKRISGLLATPLGSTPEEMRKLTEESLKTWGPVVNAAKIEIN